MEVVILFDKYIQKESLRKVETLNLPLKLKMVVMAKNSDIDNAATTELYARLYDALHPLPPDDEDDSWMYHSRLILW